MPEVEYIGWWRIGTGFYTAFVMFVVSILTIARLDDLNRWAIAGFSQDIPPELSDRLSMAFHDVIADKPFLPIPGLPGPIHTMLGLLIMAYALGLALPLFRRYYSRIRHVESPYHVW